MRRNALLWVVAFVVMVVVVAWQRLSGPTFPTGGTVTLGGREIRLRLERTHTGPTDQLVRIVAPDTAVRGQLLWRRHPSNDEARIALFERHGDTLVSWIPNQPPAGKVAYEVRLLRDGERVTFPRSPAVTRFKGDISAPVFILHLVAIFGALMLSTRAGLAAWARDPATRRYTWLTVGCFAAGAFVLGPLMQYQAFGLWWTGIPFGWDVTDNKVLVAAAAWGWALWRLRGGREAWRSVVVAAAVTLAVFAIPHSVLGTQIDWRAAGG